jgi:DNA topoisomerase-1
MSNTLIITRQKNGKAYTYSGPDRVITDTAFIQWVNSLAIPPAWTDVKVSRSPRAKVLATGHDDAGRQQSIYNPTFRAKQERLKFDRILRFAEALPAMRRQIERDLQRKRLDKYKVLACIVKLIDQAYFRVGNERYAKENQSYGITTLRSKHLTVRKDTVTFDFIGKSGKEHIKQITDKQIARIVRKLDEFPGYEIFRYQDASGALHDIDSSDVNMYIKEIMGEEFSAKDFRTWGGTLLATSELLACDYYENKKQRQKMITSIVKSVAKRLGNTPAIARSSYIDPRVITAYVDSSKIRDVQQAMHNMRPKKYLTRDEQSVLHLLNVTT